MKSSDFFNVLASLKITKDAYKMAEVIGVRIIRKLKELENKSDAVWESFLEWIISAPEDVKKFVLESCAPEDGLIFDDEIEELSYALEFFYVSEIEGLILIAGSYLEESDKIIKGILMILENYDPLHPDAPNTLKIVLDVYLNEIAEFAEYAGLYD